MTMKNASFEAPIIVTYEEDDLVLDTAFTGEPSEHDSDTPN